MPDSPSLQYPYLRFSILLGFLARLQIFGSYLDFDAWLSGIFRKLFFHNVVLVVEIFSILLFGRCYDSKCIQQPRRRASTASEVGSRVLGRVKLIFGAFHAGSLEFGLDFELGRVIVLDLEAIVVPGGFY